MVDPGGSTSVVVTWAKDRDRWAHALREFPVSQLHRRAVIGGAIFSAAMVAITAVLEASDGVRVGRIAITSDGSPLTAYLISLLPLVLALGATRCARRALLSTVSDGTLTWRIDDAGIRIEGDIATELPWSQLTRWRRAAGHLIVEARRPSKRVPIPASAAPLASFGPAEWESTEALLRARVGPEGVRIDR